MMKSTTIGKAFKLKSGIQLSAKNMSGTGYPVYGGNGINGYHNEYQFADSKIIIGRVGAYCGNVQRSKPKSWITDNALYIDKKLIQYDDEYLVHLLRNLNLNKYSSKSGQPLISYGRIKDVAIPLPTLDIQKKIAAILDEADKLRRLNQQLIDKYDALTKSLFLEMFGDPVSNPKGWDIVKIRDLILEAKYGTSSKASSEGKYPYLRMNNITYQGFMDYTELKFINISDKDRPKYSVHKGDVLFNRTNSKELVGKTGLFQAEEEMIIAGYLIRVRTNELANPYYLWAHLNSRWAKLTLQNMCKNIVGMANINAQELQDIRILRAPIKLQYQFAERVQDIEAQKAQAQASLKKSEELFQSLLQRAFKGELVDE